MTRELLTLNWEQVLGNFTFRYLCRFFSVHLLTTLIRFEDTSIIFLENPLTIIKVFSFSQKKPTQILSKKIVQKIVENFKP
jgi:hypothetical protein